MWSASAVVAAVVQVAVVLRPLCAVVAVVAVAPDLAPAGFRLHWQDPPRQSLLALAELEVQP
jgi:hypothetical protein